MGGTARAYGMRDDSQRATYSWRLDCTIFPSISLRHWPETPSRLRRQVFRFYVFIDKRRRHIDSRRRWQTGGYSPRTRTPLVRWRPRGPLPKEKQDRTLNELEALKEAMVIVAAARFQNGAPHAQFRRSAATWRSEETRHHGKQFVAP